MLNKKERILVLITHNEDGKWTQDGCFANDRYAICSASMTCQEAIEVMAKALRSNIVETQAQCSCLNMAEVALNALIEKLKVKRKGTW